MEKKKYFDCGNWTAFLLFTGFMLAGMFAFQLDSSGNTAADLYSKSEFMVPMRDGVKLFTSVYTPKGEGPHPILMKRTPYSVGPYGEQAFPSSLGPSSFFMEDGYIFVYQDVRGTYMSEGEFINMRPHRADKVKNTEIDESTDTWDTIEWLLENIPGHNGKVGMWGISYPGFYAAAGMIDAHPALRAVSPRLRSRTGFLMISITMELFSCLTVLTSWHPSAAPGRSLPLKRIRHSTMVLLMDTVFSWDSAPWIALMKGYMEAM